jgi:hypothetical protein
MLNNADFLEKSSSPNFTDICKVTDGQENSICCLMVQLNMTRKKEE